MPSTVSTVSKRLFRVLSSPRVFSSTTRFAVPSTSKSIRQLKKCWWAGAAMFCATSVLNASPVKTSLTPRLNVVPVAPARTSMPPSSRNTYSTL